MSNKAHTLVIGGGFSGLVVARERARAGHPVTVVEAADHVGGAVWSHEVGDVESHTGAEAFAIGRGAVLELVKELGIDSKIASPSTGTSFIVTDTGAYPSPKNAIMGLPSTGFAPDIRRALGTLGALRVAIERFLPARVGMADGVSIGEFVRTRYGRRVLDRLVAPIIQGIHSADPEKFELKSVLPQLPALVAEHGSAQRAIEHMLRERGKRSGSGSAVHSLVPSMAELPKALVRDIEEHGGTVMTGCRVESMTARTTDKGAHEWVMCTGEGSDARTFTAQQVVVATGPDAARQILKDTSPTIAALIPEAPATPVRLVTLALDNPELDAKPRGNGVLVAPGTTTIRAKAMTHASAKWTHVGDAARAVKEGRHIVRLSYGRGDHTGVPHESEFPQLALADAARILGLQTSALNLADYALTDWTGTMRQSGPGHAAALSTLAEELERLHHGADSPLPYLELTGAWRAGNGLEAITRFSRELQ